MCVRANARSPLCGQIEGISFFRFWHLETPKNCQQSILSACIRCVTQTHDRKKHINFIDAYRSPDEKKNCSILIVWFVYVFLSCQMCRRLLENRNIFNDGKTDRENAQLTENTRFDCVNNQRINNSWAKRDDESAFAFGKLMKWKLTKQSNSIDSFVNGYVLPHLTRIDEAVDDEDCGACKRTKLKYHTNASSSFRFAFFGFNGTKKHSRLRLSSICRCRRCRFSSCLLICEYDTHIHAHIRIDDIQPTAQLSLTLSLQTKQHIFISIHFGRFFVVFFCEAQTENENKIIDAKTIREQNVVVMVHRTWMYALAHAHSIQIDWRIVRGEKKRKTNRMKLWQKQNIKCGSIFLQHLERAIDFGSCVLAVHFGQARIIAAQFMFSEFCSLFRARASINTCKWF